jgi:hypothetical protein
MKPMKWKLYEKENQLSPLTLLLAIAWEESAGLILIRSLGFIIFRSDNSNFGFYAGGNITLVKTVGLGFTVGDMFSLSTSISVLDRVILMVGIFQTERSITLSSFDYTLGFDPVEFIAQLRIKY